MKKTGICPKCGCTDIIADARAVDRGDMNRPRDMEVATFRRPEAETLVDALLDGHAVPKSEPRDATHIAIATANGIDYLASWNFRHILNPTTVRLIESVCRDSGFDPPLLVTPQQLFESFDDS